MSTPGLVLTGMTAREVYQDGNKQFQCIKALSEKFAVDALVTFMDLSVEAETFGSSTVFLESEPPTITAPLVDTPEAIEALAVPEVGMKRSGECLKCARLCAACLDKPVFGGMIGPYTLAGRLADMTEMMMMAAAEPEMAHALIRKTTDFLKRYVVAIKETGVSGVIIAEPAAGLISPDMCDEFSSAYLKEIVEAVKDDSFMVVLHNCGRVEKQIPSILTTGVDAIHVGNAVNILDILPQVPVDTVVMGNLDPVGLLKFQEPAQVKEATRNLLASTAGYPNYVLSSGCDMPYGVPLENIEAMMDALRQYNSPAEC